MQCSDGAQFGHVPASPVGPGTVPCNFHLLVHEATQVPSSCQSLSVAWRKGVRKESTPEVPVINSRVVWEHTIPVCSLLFRGAEAEGKVEAKLCWLEVAQEDGQVLGHAQLDLAEFCDGEVHERVLQVWKTGSPTSTSGDTRVRISILARGLGLASMIRPEQSLRPHFPSEVSPRVHGGSPQEGYASHRGSEDSQQLDHLFRNVAPTALSPRQFNLSPSNAAANNTQQTMLGSVLADSIEPPIAYETTSVHAAILSELPARLVALCNRQCVRSGLSSTQQEDALEVFTTYLRRRRESILPCGIVFSTIPPPVAASAAKDVAVNVDAASSNQDATPSNQDGHLMQGDAIARDSAEIAEPGVVPPLTMVGTPETAVDSTQHACTRHLYELLSHLSDIRSLVMTLVPGIVPSNQKAESPLAAPEENFSTPSPLAKEISNAAATFAAVANAGIAMKDAPSITPGADASAGEPESRTPPIGDRFRADSVRSAERESVFSDERDRRRADSMRSSERRRTDSGRSACETSPSVSGSPINNHLSKGREVLQKFTTMVSQILQAIDQAVGIGEQVLKEVNEDLSALLIQLGDVSRDRELWAHRFLAGRELHHVTSLLEQASQMDKMGFAVMPRAASM